MYSILDVFEYFYRVITQLFLQFGKLAHVTRNEGSDLLAIDCALQIFRGKNILALSVINCIITCH